MLLIEPSESLIQTIQSIRHNVLKYTYFNNIPEGSKYQESIVTPSIEKEILQAYSSIGVKHTLKRNVSSLYNIPYNQRVSFSTIISSNNGFSGSFKCLSIPKGKLTPVDYPHVDPYFKMHLPLIYYNEDVMLPMISENNLGWMTPTEMELNTMKNSISKAHGNVLTYGLGIGFFQYMCLEKTDVKHIAIVEKNPQIINIFKEYLLPQFPRKDDITIIEADAFSHLSDEVVESFDYTFVDIWRNNNDGLPLYDRLIKQLSNFDNIDFWIEDTMLFDVKQAVFLYISFSSKGTINNPK